MVCDHGSKDIYGTAVTKFNIKPGSLLSNYASLVNVQVRKSISLMNTHKQSVSFTTSKNTNTERLRNTRITWEAKFEKNKYDAYIESITSEKGMKKLLEAIDELKNLRFKNNRKSAPKWFRC